MVRLRKDKRISVEELADRLQSSSIVQDIIEQPEDKFPKFLREVEIMKQKIEELQVQISEEAKVPSNQEDLNRVIS